MANRLMPPAFMAVISLSELSRVKATSTPVRNDIGMVNIRKEGTMEIMNQKTKEAPMP